MSKIGAFWKNSSTLFRRSSKYSELSMGLPIRPGGSFTSCHQPKTAAPVETVMIAPRSAMNAARTSDISIVVGLFLPLIYLSCQGTG